MQGKVTLEDHFAIDATLGDSQPFAAHVWPELRHRLLDFHDQRLRLMDESGVEIMIASLNSPAIQAIANAKQDPELATQELQRTIKDLGFKGALVNGYSQVEETDKPVHYDLPQYRPFW